ncbi:MAG: glucokinase [Thermodesulfobacteriota bacterium]
MVQESTILAADIGGTKTYAGLFTQEQGRLRPTLVKRLVNTDFDSVEALLSSFINEAGGLDELEISGATLGVACPVEGNRCSLTNTPWVIDGSVIAGMLGLGEVKLLNDLEATGWGIDALEREDIQVINAGVRRGGNAALIAAGTGLGEAILFSCDGSRRPSATEGGHTDFAPCSELEMELLSDLMRRFGHVSYERILSGNGLGNIYRFLQEKAGETMPPAAKQALENNGGGEFVFKEAREKANPRAAEALRIFVSIYGAEAGNLALKSLSTGGLYIGGGIAAKIFGESEEKTFMESFVRKGRFRELLLDIPVYLIKNDKAGLLGAAKYASYFLLEKRIF